MLLRAVLAHGRRRRDGDHGAQQRGRRVRREIVAERHARERQLLDLAGARVRDALRGRALRVSGRPCRSLPGSGRYDMSVTLQFFGLFGGDDALTCR